MRKSFSGVEVKDAEKGQVSAVFATFNVVDKDGDLILPTAIKDGAAVVISAYGHQSHYGALPVGKGTIRTTDSEAILDGHFFLNTTAGRETFEVVKELGPLGEWSFSLDKVTRKSVETPEGRHFIIEDIGLIKEASPVLLGAGVNTRTLVAKGLKFSEEGDAVMAAVDAYLERAQEVVVLRAGKGRELSSESTDLLKRMDAQLVVLRDLLEGDTKAAEGTEPDAEADPTPEDIKALAAEARRLDLFSNIPNGE